MEVVVIEKEPQVAMHTSSRNTGVVHSPFYLNPEKKGKLAKAALVSHELWKRFAEKKGLTWKTVGTLEIALEDTQHKILEKYLKWGIQNGISEKDLQLLDRDEVAKKEPNVSCYSAVFCKTDVAVDYGKLTQELKNESQKNGTKFLLNHKVESIENKNEPIINFENKTQLSCDFVINCAGGYSLNIAKEWLSSVSKVVMIERIQKFIPKVKPAYFLERGTAGIRTPIITPEGKFLPDVMEIEGHNSYHILNYNSPGATGAPAYSAYVVKSLQEKGLLKYTKHTKESIWNFEKTI